jgi:hypothetical protein
MNWTRPHSEIQGMLEQQREALIASCKSYDEGNRWEALRIATAVYIIVHDGGRRSKSILTQLGLRGSLRFVGSGIPCIAGNLAPEAVLAQMRIWKDGKAEYVPWLDKKAGPLRSLQFHDWWDKETIYRDAELGLTRRGLVFSLRNQEGGAHVDCPCSKSTTGLIRLEILVGWSYRDDHGGDSLCHYFDLRLSSSQPRRARTQARRY